MRQEIANFLSIDKTKLAIFLVFSLVALAFFASPLTFLFLALPVGGLYYFFLAQVFQALGFSYYPSLGDITFSIILSTTALGYFYLLSSYIMYVARRKHDLVGLAMIASIALVFISPFLILSFPPAVPSIEVSSYDIADSESCIGFPVRGAAMEWDEESKTCYLAGTFVEGYGLVTIADDVTFEIRSGGNFTTTRTVNNNGTLIVNEGGLKNVGGYIYNGGTIDIRNGTLVNDGTIESSKRHDSYEVHATMPPSRIVNRAVLENRGYIQNYGSFTNLGSFDNSGQVQFFSESTVRNAGKISISGRIEVAGEFNNEGEVLNAGVLAIYQHLEGSATNRPTLVDNSGEIINTIGQIQNLGEVNNYGNIRNDLGRLENQGTINNKGIILNASDGQFLNDGVIKNYCNGVIEGQTQIRPPIDFCLA